MKIESVEMKTNAENLSANVQILERNCIGNQYPVRKNSVFKRSRLNLTSLPSASCFRIQEDSVQRRKCACAARGLRAVPGGVRTTIAKHHGRYSKSDHLRQDMAWSEHLDCRVNIR